MVLRLFFWIVSPLVVVETGIQFINFTAVERWEDVERRLFERTVHSFVLCMEVLLAEIRLEVTALDEALAEKSSLHFGVAHEDALVLFLCLKVCVSIDAFKAFISGNFRHAFWVAQSVIQALLVLQDQVLVALETRIPVVLGL